MHRFRCALVLALAAVAGCSDMAKLPDSAVTGPRPQLAEPSTSLIPTVNIAPAKGWSDGARPIAAAGTEVKRFADKLDHPRWLYVLPNGDVLVAETNRPPKGDLPFSFKRWAMSVLMKRAGAGTPSANRIALLRDTNGDGVVDLHTTLLEGLNSPFGMALIGDQLYVANTDAVVRFPYRDGQTRIDAAAVKVVDLPAGPNNQHWTRGLVASPDGARLYVSVGCDSNIAEGGIEKEAGRAAIWEIDLARGTHRILASGLRNPVGMAWEPQTGALWVVVNERDELGSDLVPDYMTAVREGAFYGWPYSYWGANVDERVEPPRPDLVAKAVVPDYALGSHTAPLGLAWSDAVRLTPALATGMFVGRHGSWNREPLAGYDVVMVPFAGGKPAGPPVAVLTGFVDAEGNALGRPVGVAIDKQGALLVADDVGNVVWRVTARAGG
jgi:glucose/arabinose dehydrogenase